MLRAKTELTDSQKEDLKEVLDRASEIMDKHISTSFIIVGQLRIPDMMNSAETEEAEFTIFENKEADFFMESWSYIKSNVKTIKD